MSKLDKAQADAIEQYIRSDPLEALYQITLVIYKQKTNNGDPDYIDRLEHLRRVILHFIRM